MPWVNILLFVLTLISTLVCGTYLAHLDPEILRFVRNLPRHPEWWLDGLAFSGTLMAILLAHEMGHYLFSLHHRVRASLPYFIPAPNLLGTFGAVILMRSRITDRKALIDIGAAGPIAGFIVSLFALVVGLYEADLVLFNPERDIVLFQPNYIMDWAMQLTPWLASAQTALPTVIMSPILDAAWVGFFVTMLNLLPVGQLDGGHITFAVFGKYARYISWGMVALLVYMARDWPGWGVFALLLVILMGRSGFKHPETDNPAEKLDLTRKLVALSTLLIFIVSFMPTPVYILGDFVLF